MKIVINGKTVEIPSGGGDGGEFAGEVYSTEEARIGTWIDGKPVYRKTLDVVIGNAAGAWTLVPGTTAMNIDTIAHVYGYVNAADGSGMIYAPNADAVFKRMNDGVYFMASANQSNTKMVLTIEYTKATGEGDTA